MSRKYNLKDKIRGNEVHFGGGMKTIPEDILVRIGYYGPSIRIESGLGAIGEAKQRRFQDDRKKRFLL